MALLSTKLPWELAQTKWASILNPLVSLPLVSGNQINSITLFANKPKVINHLLQRMPQGWIICDKDSKANVWRPVPFNDLTITLESDADTNINMFIF